MLLADTLTLVVPNGQLIVEPGGTLMGYDQALWADELRYHDHSYEDALEIVRLVRKTTYQLLKQQPDEVFEHSVKHPEYDEPYTFEKWLHIYSEHIPGHIEQIKNNYLPKVLEVHQHPSHPKG